MIFVMIPLFESYVVFWLYVLKDFFQSVGNGIINDGTSVFRHKYEVEIDAEH